MPDEWKSLIPDEDKAAAIESTILATEIVPPPTADDGEFLPFGYKAESSTVYLRVLFAGYQLRTVHRIANANAEQMRRYRALTSRTRQVSGSKINHSEIVIPSRARELGKFYDEMMQSVEGYAGRVPLTHKVAVILSHLSSEQEAVAKN